MEEKTGEEEEVDMCGYSHIDEKEHVELTVSW
jgi:hypothetical protein